MLSGKFKSLRSTGTIVSHSLPSQRSPSMFNQLYIPRKSDLQQSSCKPSRVCLPSMLPLLVIRLYEEVTRTAECFPAGTRQPTPTEDKHASQAFSSPPTDGAADSRLEMSITVLGGIRSPQHSPVKATFIHRSRKTRAGSGSLFIAWHIQHFNGHFKI